MNTDPKNNHPLRAPSHPELGPDTNPSTEYEVKFVLREDYSLVMTVEANSQAEAEEKAKNFNLDLLEDWDFVDADITIESVQPANGEESDE